MTLTKNDIQTIREVMTDVIDFAIDKSEKRMEKKLSTLMDEKINVLRDEMHSEIGDLADMNRDFLAKLDNHEQRITRLEVIS